MDIADFKIQILIVLAAIAFLWLFFKAMKLIWKLGFIFLIFLGLSFALPAIRQWIFDLL